MASTTPANSSPGITLPLRPRDECERCADCVQVAVPVANLLWSSVVHSEHSKDICKVHADRVDSNGDLSGPRRWEQIVDQFQPLQISRRVHAPHLSRSRVQEVSRNFCLVLQGAFQTLSQTQGASLDRGVNAKVGKERRGCEKPRALDGGESEECRRTIAEP
eukprot:1144727-Rhodomonas_salina.1